jgi:hypothetical protein
VGIGNTGSAVLLVPTIAIEGPHAGDFGVVGAPSTTVNPGTSGGRRVLFFPSDFGVRTATLVITSNDTDEPRVEIPLNGVGVHAGPTGASTQEVISAVLGHTVYLPAFPPVFLDVNGDGEIDAADVTENVNVINNP